MTDRVIRWLQILGNIGVIGGLILVALQMRQNTEITRAQLAHDAWIANTSMTNAVMGEEPALTKSQIFVHENELSDKDIVAIDAYFRTIQAQIYRIEYTNNIGLDLYSPELTARSVAVSFVDGYGRIWWDLNKEDLFFFAPKISNEIEALLQSDGVPGESDRFKKFADAVRDSAGDDT